MKVVVFSTHIIWPYHYETELEIMQSHLDQGHELIQLVCNASFGICDTNLEHNVYKCMTCINRRKAGVAELQGKVKELEILDFTGPEELQAASKMPCSFDSLDKLQELHLGNYPIGYAVGSTLISLLRSTTIDLSSGNKKLGSLMRHAALTYYACKNFLEKEKPDLVYVFNGRIPNPRAMISACHEAGITCMIHERGNSYKYYEIFTNKLPQDLNYRQDLSLTAWENGKEPERSKLAHDFFINRRKGQEQGWHSFVSHQKDGLLPENWDSKKHNIVIFNSSEDEYLSCSEDWKNKLYPSQYKAIRRICNDLKDQPDIQIYLRCHPNLAGASDSEKKELASMKNEPLVCIAPEDTISTYALLDNCSVVLTFGSTVGIEATYWDKPSVLAGPSLYDRLESTYNPQSHEDVITLLKNRDLKPKEKQGALIYGYYYNSYGKNFKYFTPESLSSGKFKGKNLMKSKRSINWTFKILDSDPTKLMYRVLARYYRNKIKGFPQDNS